MPARVIALAIPCTLVAGALLASSASAQAATRSTADTANQGPEVPLTTLLEFAAEHAPRVHVGRARIGLAEAEIAGAAPRVPGNPTISFGVGAGLNPLEDHVDFNGSLSQRFEVAGEPRLRRRAAHRARARREAELREAAWEVRRGVRAAYYAALIARARLGVAHRIVAFQRRLLEIAERRLSAGDVPRLAVRVAEGELSQARVARIDAAQAHLRARLEICARSGWPAAHPPRPVGELEVPRVPPADEVLLALTDAKQPRLAALRATQREAGARLELADRTRWPTPTVGVQVNRESFFAGPPETQVLGTLSLPIPVAQRRQGERAQAAAQQRVAGAERDAARVELQSRIRQLRAGAAAAAERAAIFGGEILPTFEENLRLIERAFELGEIDILRVSVARERFLRVQLDALETYGDYYRAVADLEAAVGAELWPGEAGGEATP